MYLGLSTYRDTSPKRNRTALGPYRRPMPRVLGESSGGERFLMGEEPLYGLGCRVGDQLRLELEHLQLQFLPGFSVQPLCLSLSISLFLSLFLSPSLSLSLSLTRASDSEPRENNFTGFKDFHLKAKARIWP